MGIDMKISNVQARRFLLRHHGLLGEHIFAGKGGIMSFINRMGCVQYDPVDICGRTADIVLHSRIHSYKKADLYALLYDERRLIDYFDKNLCILPIAYFPIFLHERLEGVTYAAAYEQRGGDAVKDMEMLVRKLIEKRGHISAKEIDCKENVNWDWGVPTSVPRAALESMYFRGELIIHHKKGTIKSYAFAKNHVPPEILAAPLPYNSREERNAWHVKRRIAAVGMLWNKASDAWIALKLKAAERTAAFAKLLADGEIFEITVEGLKEPLYICENEREALEAALSLEENTVRAEFIAPLDSLMWDRKLIAALFGFEYKWEIYTPQAQRKYGPYTLPFLYGDALVARADMARKDGRLVVNNIWTEGDKPLHKEAKAAFESCVARFADFNTQDRSISTS
ncbi:MAG: winged helix DNA-binding domain-containing protein [Defluviitaleaceae bacterium]|nr:winged helix DNA-binding domain-containing protein [Defluviitaleaceae bacterium]